MDASLCQAVFLNVTYMLCKLTGSAHLGQCVFRCLDKVLPILSAGCDDGCRVTAALVAHESSKTQIFTRWKGTWPGSVHHFSLSDTVSHLLEAVVHILRGWR